MPLNPVKSLKIEDWRNFSSPFIVVCPRPNTSSRTLNPRNLSLVFKAIINSERKHIYVFHEKLVSGVEWRLWERII